MIITGYAILSILVSILVIAFFKGAELQDKAMAEDEAKDREV